MSDLTVSSAVDTFMQASDKPGMLAALGTGNAVNVGQGNTPVPGAIGGSSASSVSIPITGGLLTDNWSGPFFDGSVPDGVIVSMVVSSGLATIRFYNSSLTTVNPTGNVYVSVTR